MSYKTKPGLLCILIILNGVVFGQKHPNPGILRNEKWGIAGAMEFTMKRLQLDKWYPNSFDTVYGGFHTSFTYDFKPGSNTDKMIVTQARHTWVNAKAMELYPQTEYFRKGAVHGFQFLKNVMWDSVYGGFFTLVDQKGVPIVNGKVQKEAYGNAFAIYALAAYYHATADPQALELARKGFLWLEKHSRDPVHKGYFQHLQRDGTPVKRTDDIPGTSDLGYKDQNSSIHLLEAFTELYQVFPDPLVRERLKEMFLLIRDTILSPRGNLVLFFHPDWKPVSFRDKDAETILKHRNLDHVSFGHDVETAYLLWEASQALAIPNDTATLRIMKRMVDHALHNGWDNEKGGFYDEGYYFKGDTGITIIKKTKNWWAQAEGLNSLLMMASLFPDDSTYYYTRFKQLWNYCCLYLIDQEFGGWFEGGLDEQPEHRYGRKGHIWKATYHTFRALSNCMGRLRK